MDYKIVTNSTSFLSGCLPIALIEFMQVIIFRTDGNNWYVEIFAKSFLALTIVSCIIFYDRLKFSFNEANAEVVVYNLKRKDMFSSGAISYYVLPFVSFVGNTVQSAITLGVVIILLLIIFNNNMMFMYTPFLDVIGYKVLEGEKKDINDNGEWNNDKKLYNILVKTDRGLFFTGQKNTGKMKEISGIIFFTSDLDEKKE